MTNLRDEDPEGQYSRSRTSEAMPILRHLRVIRRFGIYILASVVVAIVLAFFGSAMLPRTYESRASLYVGQRLDDVSLDYDGVLASQRLAETYARIALTEPVLNAVRQRLQLDATIEEMEARVRTELPLEETVLTVIAQSGDPGEAAAVANAVVDELRERAPADQAAEERRSASSWLPWTRRSTRSKGISRTCWTSRPCPQATRRGSLHCSDTLTH